MDRPGSDPGAPEGPDSAHETSRQRLARWLAQDAYDFEQLREALQLSSRELEHELRHVQRSLRHGKGRLVVTAPRCRDCEFGFPGRESRHLHPPGRCPRCKGQRILPPFFRISSG